MCCDPRADIECGVDESSDHFIFCHSCFIRTFYFLYQAWRALPADKKNQAGYTAIIQSKRTLLKEALGLAHVWPAIEGRRTMDQHLEDYMADVCASASARNLFSLCDGFPAGQKTGGSEEVDEYGLLECIHGHCRLEQINPTSRTNWAIRRGEGTRAVATQDKNTTTGHPEKTTNAAADTGIAAALLGHTPRLRAPIPPRPNATPNGPARPLKHTHNIHNVPDNFYNPGRLWPRDAKRAPVPRVPVVGTPEWEEAVLATIAQEEEEEEEEKEKLGCGSPAGLGLEVPTPPHVPVVGTAEWAAVVLASIAREEGQEEKKSGRPAPRITMDGWEAGVRAPLLRDGDPIGQGASGGRSTTNITAVNAGGVFMTPSWKEIVRGEGPK